MSNLQRKKIIIGSCLNSIEFKSHAHGEYGPRRKMTDVGYLACRISTHTRSKNQECRIHTER